MPHLAAPLLAAAAVRPSPPLPPRPLTPRHAAPQLLLLPPAALSRPLFRSASPLNDEPLEARPHTFGFVCGVHFSGTSVLHYALGRHPSVSIMRVAPQRQDEGQFFQDVLPTAEQLGTENLAEALSALSAKKAVAEVGRFFALRAVRPLRPSAPLRLLTRVRAQRGRLDESSPSLTAASTARLRQQWGAHWNTSRSVLVEKAPPDLIRMRFLAAVFPPAWFLVTLRHPLAVCRRVPPKLHLLCVVNWLNAYEWAAADAAEGQLSVHFLFYENWAAAPVRGMQALSAELELPDSPGFEWADAIVEGADVGLEAHAATGWGYVGKKGAGKGGPPGEGEPVYVDPSRLLPEPELDIRLLGEGEGKGGRGAGQRRRWELSRLEGRLNAFGYSFHEPFLTNCSLVLRQLASCPPLVALAGEDPMGMLK